jgi:uncharacterized protein (TIGR03083 family)
VLDLDRYRAALTEQTVLLAAAVRDADQALAVPTCPDWSLGKLAQHVGRVHRWASAIIERRAAERVDPRTVEDGRMPDDPDGRARWLAAGAERVGAAGRVAGPDAPVWTWAGPGNVTWWVRRAVHETVVHRADAELALGRPFDVEPELAADGVSEWLSLLGSPRLSQRTGGPLLTDGQLLHLHATDDGLGPAGEWMVRGTGSGFAVEPGHGKGDAAVRGPAADLLLVFLRRRPVDSAVDTGRVQVHGDRALLDDWLARTAF